MRMHAQEHVFVYFLPTCLKFICLCFKHRFRFFFCPFRFRVVSFPPIFHVCIGPDSFILPLLTRAIGKGLGRLGRGCMCCFCLCCFKIVFHLPVFHFYVYLCHLQRQNNCVGAEMHNRSILFFSKPFTDVRHFKHRLLAFRHSGFLYAM